MDIHVYHGKPRKGFVIYIVGGIHPYIYRSLDVAHKWINSFILFNPALALIAILFRCSCGVNICKQTKFQNTIIQSTWFFLGGSLHPDPKLQTRNTAGAAENGARQQSLLCDMQINVAVKCQQNKCIWQKSSYHSKWTWLWFFKATRGQI